jgi:hypothetical protein
VDEVEVANNTVEKIVFWGTPYGKVTVVWNLTPIARSYVIAAESGSPAAKKVDRFGTERSLTASSSYTFDLPGATDNNGNDGNDYIIGGTPYLLVESTSATGPTPTATAVSKVLSSQVSPLLAKMPQDFTLYWTGTPGTYPIQSYDIEYRDAANVDWWSLVYNTPQTSTTFTGILGHTYYFRSRARDTQGNLEAWPSSPDTSTTIGDFPYKSFFPLVNKNSTVR